MLRRLNVGFEKGTALADVTKDVFRGLFYEQCSVEQISKCICMAFE